MFQIFLSFNMSPIFKKIALIFLFSLSLLTSIAGCSSPEERAEKYYLKGMALLEKDPEKARLEFYNALQIKRNMTRANYGIALVAERRNDWKTAFDRLSQVLEQEPNHIEALVKTGKILFAGGKIDLAIEKSDKALALDQNNVGALNLRAALRLKLNDANGAIKFANLALAREPDNQDAYMVLATERLSANDDAGAIAYFDKILAKDEKNLTIQLIKIKALENLFKLEEAEHGYKNLISLLPDSSFARKSYAHFLVKQDRKHDAELQFRAIAIFSPKDNQPKLDVVRFVIATQGAAAGRAELEDLVNKDPKNYGLAFALVGLYQVQKDAALEAALLNQIAKNAGDTSDGFKAQAIIAYNLIQQGKKDEASKLLNYILAADKSNGQALIIKAGLAVQAKNYAAAIADLRTVLRDSPDSSKASFMLATAYNSSGSFELAEEQYASAFVSSRYASQYALAYAQFLLSHQHSERAEKVLQDSFDANFSDDNLIHALAQLKIARGDYDGAQKLAEKVNVTNKVSVSDQILGAISSSENDIDGSLVDYLRAHETDPKDSKPIIAIVNTYMQVGKNAEALAFVDDVLKENPNHAHAKLLQGQIYASNGNDQKASQAFASIIEAQPNNALAYRELALAQQRANKLDAAKKTINQGLLVLPNDVELKIVQANICEAMGHYEDAIKSYEEILKIRPDSPTVANNLANLLLNNRADQASVIRAYDLVKLFKDSHIPQLLDTYGWASYKAGNLYDAEKAFKLAIEKSPKVPIFYFHLAKVYIAKNDKIQAKQALQQSIQQATTQHFDKKLEADLLLNTL